MFKLAILATLDREREATESEIIAAVERYAWDKYRIPSELGDLVKRSLIFYDPVTEKYSRPYEEPRKKYVNWGPTPLGEKLLTTDFDSQEVQILRELPAVTDQIQEATGLSNRIVYRLCRKLERLGLVRRLRR